MGGEYENPAVQSYVSSMGLLLARTSERPNLPWKFTVLDTPDVNAFALPGGYIYVTRGLLILADNEAELASVLGHEIGHVTARHAAQRQGRATIAGIGAAAVGILTGSGELANVAGTLGQGYVQSYSRDQEFQADTLGVRYMARANYDPQASATFLDKLLQDTRLRAAEAGDPDAADRVSMTSSHPRTADRVERAIENAGVTAVKNPLVERDLYLSKIDGIIYGDNPEQGIVRGRTFLHPGLGFAFDVPAGFQVINMPTQVAARSKDGIMVFDRAEPTPSGSVVTYLANDRELGLEDVERIDVNGMEGATGTTRGKVGNQTVDVRVVAIRSDSKSVYRFLFATPPARTQAMSEPFRETTYSFRRLSKSEAAAIKPLKIVVVTVKSGDTAESLGRRMAVSNSPVERFRVLNGLAKTGQPKPGAKVKIVQ